jgi:hypothetical protein
MTLYDLVELQYQTMMLYDPSVNARSDYDVIQYDLVEMQYQTMTSYDLVEIRL